MKKNSRQKNWGPTFSREDVVICRPRNDSQTYKQERIKPSQTPIQSDNVSTEPRRNSYTNSTMSDEESNDSTDSGVITVMRNDKITRYDDEDLNNLYKEMEAEKRFLKTNEDVTKIQLELKKIKDAGGHVVDLSNKVEGLETALKIAAKDKYDQEKEMVELRNEIADLREWNNNMEDLVPKIQFEEKSPEPSIYFVNDLPSIRSGSPNPSICSFASSNMAWTKVKEQEEQMAKLHKKIDLLQMQNKDQDVENLKAQVQQLSETIEKLIKGFQTVAKKNPEITAELNSIRKSLPKPQASVLRETLSLPSKQRFFKRKSNKRQIWCTELKLSDFKEGPVSFML